METTYERCCGLDVHKETVVACVLTSAANGRTKKEIRTFRAHTRGLLELREWLLSEQVQGVAMESTGVYWKPVYAVLEEEPTLQLVIGNAQHIKNVPGRKTDVQDAEWIARLLRYGLIRSSFVPPQPIRELRDLVRYRTTLVEERTRERNRVLKVLQSANIKLDGVVSDAFGVSGMAMLRAMAEGRMSPQEMAGLAKGVMRKKIDALEIALEGRLAQHHREMLTIALRRLDQAESDIASAERLIDSRLQPFRDQHELLQQIPGVDKTVAAALLAELGPDMSVFPTAGHAASWAGICPGNHESAGKRPHGRPTLGNRHLKTVLCQAANSASRKRGSYLRDKFFRLKARRGHTRAVVAIGHKILVAAYHMLAGNKAYRDLGESYLAQRDQQRTVSRLVQRLKTLGLSVTVTPAPEPTSA
jgi:transposase